MYLLTVIKQQKLNTLPGLIVFFTKMASGTVGILLDCMSMYVCVNILELQIDYNICNYNMYNNNNNNKTFLNKNTEQLLET